MTKELDRNAKSKNRQRIFEEIAYNYLDEYYVENQNEQNLDQQTIDGQKERVYLLKNEANRQHLAQCIHEYINDELVKVLVDDQIIVDFTESANNDHTHFKSLNKGLSEKLNKAIQQIKGKLPFDNDNRPLPITVKRISEGGFKVMRLDEIHRLIFKVIENRVIVISCYYHTL